MSTETGGQAIVRAQPVSILRCQDVDEVLTWASSSTFRVASFVGRWLRWGLMRMCRRRLTSCLGRCFKSRQFQRHDTIHIRTYTRTETQERDGNVITSLMNFIPQPQPPPHPIVNWTNHCSPRMRNLELNHGLNQSSDQTALDLTACTFKLATALNENE